MTHAASSAAARPSTTQGALLTRHHFLLRRLHSLTGLVPVGVFLCFHLFTNFQMAIGDFQHEVEWIHSLPALLILEVFGLWLPIAFHAVLGVFYIFSGKWSSPTYNYGGAWRFTLQRWTAWIALFFILYHVATLRWGWTIPGFVDYPFLATGLDSYPLAFVTTAIALQGGPLGGAINVTLYLIGVLATVYHFANGLWTAAITWGLTLSVAAMRRWGYICVGIGIVLSIFSIAAIVSAFTYDITEADWEAVKAAVAHIQAHGALPH